MVSSMVQNLNSVGVWILSVDFLSHFMLNSNLSLIHSEVNIPEKEFENMKDFDSKRRLPGRSMDSHRISSMLN